MNINLQETQNIIDSTKEQVYIIFTVRAVHERGGYSKFTVREAITGFPFLIVKSMKKAKFLVFDKEFNSFCGL